MEFKEAILDALPFVALAIGLMWHYRSNPAIRLMREKTHECECQDWERIPESEMFVACKKCGKHFAYFGDQPGMR